MLKIRMSRGGAKRRPFYKIVIADSRRPRDGKFIEKVGFFNPLLPKDKKERLSFDVERITYWLKKGAKPSYRIAKFLGEAKIIPMPEKRKRQGLTVGDYLRIASSGLEILGAPSEGSGFKGTLASASGPLSKLGVDLGTSIDARDQKIDEDYREALDKRTDLVTSITGAQAEFDIGKMKAKGEKEFIVEPVSYTHLTLPTNREV